MGNQIRAPAIPAPSDFKYFVVMFSWPDRIISLYHDKKAAFIIRRATDKFWSPGIREEQQHRIALCLKLSKGPWEMGTDFEKSVNAKKMTCDMLTELHGSGWRVALSTDLSMRVDLTTWFFRQADAVALLKPVVAISISSYNKLQLINPGDDLEQVLNEALEIGYVPGSKEDRRDNNVIEYVLEEDPWQADGEPAIHARRLLVEVLKQFYLRKYRLYTTANLKGSADTLYFIYDAVLVVDPQVEFFAISLDHGDRIRVIAAPESVLDVVKYVLNCEWMNGFEDQGSYYGAREIKLSGNPWSTEQPSEIIDGRRMITRLLGALLANGWDIYGTIDVSRSINDKSVFVFRNCTPQSVSHACLSLNLHNRIRFVDVPDDLRQEIKKLVQRKWSKGIKRRVNHGEGTEEIRVKGSPWESSRYGDGLAARSIMVLVFNLLEKKGWRVVSSADTSSAFAHQSNGPDYPMDVHCWFIRQEKA